MYSSELVCLALGFTPSPTLGQHAEHDGCCGICGKPVHEGEKAEPLEFKSSFVDHNLCVNPAGEYACVYCTEIMDRSVFQQKLSTGVFTRDGMYPAAKKIHRAHFLLNPPPPPFSFAIQNGKSQHIVWKAPVNLSREVFVVQLGGLSLTVRHAKLIAAVALVHQLRDTYCQWEAAIAEQKGNKPKAIDRNALRALGYTDMKGQVVRTFMPARWLTDMIEQGQIEETTLAPFYALNWAESWLLDTASLEDDAVAIKPEPLSL